MVPLLRGQCGGSIKEVIHGVGGRIPIETVMIV